MHKNNTKKHKLDPDEFRPSNLASSWHEHLLSDVMRVPDDAPFEAPVDINAPLLVWLLTVSFMAGADVALAGATASIANCKGIKETQDAQWKAAVKEYESWLRKAKRSIRVEIEAGNYTYPAKHRR